MGQEDGAAAGRAAGSAGHRANLVLPEQKLNTGQHPPPPQIPSAAAAQAPRISYCLGALL